MRFQIFLLLTVAAAILGCATRPDAPAGCLTKAHFPAKAYEAWRQAPTHLTSSETIANAPLLQIGVRTTVQLKKTENENRGFVQFQTQSTADYFIVSDFYPRLNILDVSSDNTSLSAEAWGPVRECDTMKKSLRFKLNGIKKYGLEIISRDSTVVSILVLPATAN